MRQEKKKNVLQEGANEGRRTTFARREDSDRYHLAGVVDGEGVVNLFVATHGGGRYNFVESVLEESHCSSNTMPVCNLCSLQLHLWGEFFGVAWSWRGKLHRELPQVRRNKVGEGREGIQIASDGGEGMLHGGEEEGK